jgi:DNA-binding transcriptional MerR regulator
MRGVTAALKQVRNAQQGEQKMLGVAERKVNVRSEMPFQAGRGTFSWPEARLQRHYETYEGSDMRIGELSKRTGASIQTLRFYEREGLLREPPRNNSGYRAYEAADTERVQFIKQSQELGFTLKEIGELVRIHGTNPAGKRYGKRAASAQHWPDAFQIARSRLELLDKKIAELNVLRTRLAAGLEGSRRQNFEVCPAGVKMNGKMTRAARPAQKVCPAHNL